MRTELRSRKGNRRASTLGLLLGLSVGGASQVAGAQQFPLPEPFVGLHGSWNRSTPSGYRVGLVPFEDGEPAGPIEDFLTGWLSNDGAMTWGRLVDALATTDGSLLISDDGAGKIWRVRYTGM